MSSTTHNKIQRMISISDCLSNGIEKDLIKFLKNQELCRLQWQKTENEFLSSKNTNVPLREENRSLAVQLDLARNQLDGALRKRPIYEKRIQILEQQLHAISALLNDMDPSEIKRMDKDTLLKMTSVNNLNEIENITTTPSHNYPVGRKSLIPSDFDDSEEETIHSHLIRAASNAKSINKRKLHLHDSKVTGDVSKCKKSPELVKCDDTVDVRTLSPIHDDEVKKELPKPSLPGQPNKTIVNTDNINSKVIYTPTNINDASLIKFADTPAVHPSAPSWDNHPAFNTESLIVTPLYPVLNDTPLVENPTTNSSHMVSKPHNMIQKKEIKPGRCTVCKKTIGFQRVFYRCQDCNIKCHEECKCLISSICQSTTDKMLLDELVHSSSAIKVPPLIMDVIKEIERRGLAHQGLYRISGSVKEIKELKVKWVDHTQINFSKISDIHVLTGVLKSYLKALSEPIVTRQYHSLFLQAAEKNDLPKIYKLIDNLPIANKHTLAYLILHLRKVARTQENLMDFKSLSRVLGPTIVGNGCLYPTNAQIYDESRLQPIVLEVFFGISEDYWNILLKPETVNDAAISVPNNKENDRKTEEKLYYQSPLLGFIDGVGEKSRHLPRKTQPPTAKPLMEKLGKKKFFDTPIVRHQL